MRHAPTLTALVLLGLAAGCDRDTPRAAARGAAPTPPPAPETPDEPLRVRVTGQDFQWNLRYPGPDRELDTADDFVARRHLHLPAETQVEIELRSDDFVYSLYLPDYELVEMAFPGRPWLVRLSTESAGTSGFLGSQMCGFTHEELLGDVVVQTADDFARWSREKRGGEGR